MNFFVNAGNPSQFWIATDANTVLNRLFGELKFYPMDNSTVGLKVVSDTYSLSNELQPWHRPSLQVTLNSSVSLYEKIILGADLNYIRGIQAMDQIGNSIELESILDLNFTSEYIVSNKMSVFLNGLNLLNQDYQLFNRYPLKGVQLLAGFRYNF